MKRDRATQHKATAARAALRRKRSKPRPLTAGELLAKHGRARARAIARANAAVRAAAAAEDLADGAAVWRQMRAFGSPWQWLAARRLSRRAARTGRG